jgi:oxygen-independent coproporphyrinogen-3 oxidase
MNEKHPETWLRLVESKGTGRVLDELIPPAAQAREYLLMGLRTCEGIDMERLAALGGQPLDAATLAGLEGLGLIERQGARLAATGTGRRVLNALISALSI